MADSHAAVAAAARPHFWNHLITIEPTQGGVLYRDQVEISARLLTPLIWMFAQIFYRHRQRRWRRLASTGFDYGAV